MRLSQLGEYDLLQALLWRGMLLLTGHHVAKALCVHVFEEARACWSGRTKRRSKEPQTSRGRVSNEARTGGERRIERARATAEEVEGLRDKRLPAGLIERRCSQAASGS